MQHKPQGLRPRFFKPMEIQKFKIGTGSAIICSHCNVMLSQSKTELRIKKGTNQLKFTCYLCNQENKIKFTVTATIHF